MAVWLNLLVIFITMGVMAHSPPNFPVAVLGSAGGKSDFIETLLPDYSHTGKSFIPLMGTARWRYRVAADLHVVLKSYCVPLGPLPPVIKILLDGPVS